MFDILSISSSDSRLNKNVNRSGSKRSAAMDGIIEPDFISPEHATATKFFETTELIELLQKPAFNFAAVTLMDYSNTNIPLIGQRLPDKYRIKKIHSHWDKVGYPIKYVVSTIVFNAELFNSNIHFNKDSLFVLYDGLGRITSLVELVKMAEKEERNVKALPPVTKNFLWQIDFDLTGDQQKLYDLFLDYNKSKQVSSGTKLGVKAAQLELTKNKPIDWSDREMAIAYVVKELYSLPVKGSILELFPWSVEGGRANSSNFKGRGKAASLDTAFKPILSDLEDGEFSVQSLPKVLDWVFRAYYKSCPKAVLNAHLVATKKTTENYHFSTTFALKVLLLLFVKLWKSSGNGKHFIAMVDEVMQLHYKGAKHLYINQKVKVMTLDKFWAESTFFNTHHFNSGEGNTQSLLSSLRPYCDLVVARKTS